MMIFLIENCGVNEIIIQTGTINQLPTGYSIQSTHMRIGVELKIVKSI